MAGGRVVATAEILSETSVAETSKAPVAEATKEHPVVMDFENLQKLGNGGVEATASAASSFAGSPDVCRRSNRLLGKVFGLESANRIKSDYAKSAYAETTFSNGSTPIEKAAVKIESVKT
jgi:hypothetical protein